MTGVESGHDESGRSSRWPAAAVLSVAVVQTALALRYRYAQDYGVTVGIAWMAALFVAAHRVDRRPGPPVRASWRAVGSALLVAACAPLAVWPVYRTIDRVLPLCAGVGLGLLALGPGLLLGRRAELLLLSLPVLNPLPRPLLDAFAPISFIAWCTTMVDRAAGQAVWADGNVVRVPNGALEVLPACSGLLSISRLAVLLALLIALFPTRPRQRLWLVVSIFAATFVTNIARLSILSFALIRGDDASFGFWHEGPGAVIFAIATTGAAGLAWWLVLRRGKDPAPVG